MGLAEGWHVLEVGAGGGSMARWLSEQVGPSGRVMATDIDLQRLLDSRRLLHEGLPEEPMHGQLPKAGIPRTFKAAA